MKKSFKSKNTELEILYDACEEVGLSTLYEHISYLASHYDDCNEAQKSSAVNVGMEETRYFSRYSMSTEQEYG
jgi:hypothetical protein